MGLCIYRPLDLTPNLYLAVLGPICIYQPGPQFMFTNPGPKFVFTSHTLKNFLPARGLSLHMLTLTSQFVFVFRALAYHFYYQSRVWTCIYLITDRSSNGSSCHSSSSNFFVIDKTNINMPILVN